MNRHSVSNKVMSMCQCKEDKDGTILKVSFIRRLSFNTKVKQSISILKVILMHSKGLKFQLHCKNFCLKLVLFFDNSVEGGPLPDNPLMNVTAKSWCRLITRLIFQVKLLSYYWQPTDQDINMLAINYVIYLMVHSIASACCQLPSEFTTATMDDKRYVKLQVINIGLV